MKERDHTSRRHAPLARQPIISWDRVIGSRQNSIRRLVVPVNGSSGDARLLELVGQLAVKEPIAVTLIYVVEVARSMPIDAELPLLIATGERVLGEAERLARLAVGTKPERVTTELLQARAAGAAIVDEAVERNADAIMLATRNRRRQGKITVGTTIPYVLKNAPCEVIVVREAVDER